MTRPTPGPPPPGSPDSPPSVPGLTTPAGSATVAGVQTGTPTPDPEVFETVVRRWETTRPRSRWRTLWWPRQPPAGTSRVLFDGHRPRVSGPLIEAMYGQRPAAWLRGWLWSPDPGDPGVAVRPRNRDLAAVADWLRTTRHCPPRPGDPDPPALRPPWSPGRKEWSDPVGDGPLTRVLEELAADPGLVAHWCETGPDGQVVFGPRCPEPALVGEPLQLPGDPEAPGELLGAWLTVTAAAVTTLGVDPARSPVLMWAALTAHLFGHRFPGGDPAGLWERFRAGRGTLWLWSTHPDLAGLAAAGGLEAVPDTFRPLVPAVLEHHWWVLWHDDPRAATVAASGFLHPEL